MTLNELDQLLLDWQKKLELASQNLLELQSLPTYQRLAGEGEFTKVPLTGTTAKAVEPALQAMHDLFQHFDLLAQTIDRALFLRRQMNSFWDADPRLQNVVELLTGKSIQLSVLPLPLSQRGLLSPAEQSYYVTPAKLLAAMQSAFDLARDQVLAVDHVWTTLESTLVDTWSEVQTLRAEGVDLTITQTTLNNLHDRLLTDPLGVQDEFNATVAPLIARARQAVTEAKQQQQNVETGLVQARQQWQELQTLYEQAIALYTETTEKVQGFNQPLPEVNLTAIEQWLIRLETKFAEGAIAPIQVGLRNWTQQVQAAIATTQTAISTQTQRLQQRQELRGRLEALQAKALARRVAEDSTLVYLATQARQLLYSRPTDLETAAELVRSYEHRLSQCS